MKSVGYVINLGVKSSGVVATGTLEEVVKVGDSFDFGVFEEGFVKLFIYLRTPLNKIFA